MVNSLPRMGAPPHVWEPIEMALLSLLLSLLFVLQNWSIQETMERLRDAYCCRELGSLSMKLKRIEHYENNTRQQLHVVK